MRKERVKEMNFSLTRMKKNFIGCACALLSFVFLSQNVYAYSADINEVTDDFYWVVDDDLASENDARVTLYMLVQPDSGYETEVGFYEFWCDEGVFDYGDGYVENAGAMKYDFNFMNKVVIDNTECGEVWTWLFGLQEGKYTFSYPDGLSHMFVLNSSLGSPFSEDGYTGNGDLVVVNEGDIIRLYALYGDYEWAKENVNFLMNWAKEREEIVNRGKGSNAEDAVETISVENEPIPDKTEEPVAVADEEVLTSADEVPTSTPSLNETENSQDEQKESALLRVIKMAPIVIVICVGLFIIKRKENNKKNREE